MTDMTKTVDVEGRAGEAEAPGRVLPRLPTFYRNYENAILAVVTVTVFLIVWELVPRLGLVKPLLVSSPTRIVKAAQWLFAHGFMDDIRVSAIEFVVGYALAVLSGIPLGILLGWYRRVNAMFDPFVSALYATPRVALLPLLILWLGIGVESKMAVVFLGAFFPVLVNTLAGVRTIDEMLLKCARSFGANDRQIFITLALPSSVPFVITGMRLGAGRGLVGVVVGELVAATAGVGYMMSIAGATFQTDKVFVGIILLAGSGYVLVEILKRLEARFESWRPERG
ncbi:MAG: ABC transporter permease [Anaerolineae bacterium]